MEALYAENLTRFQIKDLIEKKYFAILPVGACEQHGPHLPIGTDNYLSSFVSERLVEKINAVIFPSVNFGYSWVWKNLPGTLTLSQHTYNLLLYELVESLIGQGFVKILIVNGHESNQKAIRYVLRDIKDHFPDITALDIFYPNMNELYDKYMETPKWNGTFHAEEWETSLMLAYDDQLVHMDKAVREYPEKPVLYGLDSSTLSTASKSGVYGDATVATKEKGLKIIEGTIDYLLGILKTIE